MDCFICSCWLVLGVVCCDCNSFCFVSDACVGLLFVFVLVVVFGVCSGNSSGLNLYSCSFDRAVLGGFAILLLFCPQYQTLELHFKWLLHMFA